jgi:hypothetical protein
MNRLYGYRENTFHHPGWLKQPWQVGIKAGLKKRPGVAQRGIFVGNNLS